MVQVASRLDQLRAMAPAVWQRQKQAAAAQLARLRASLRGGEGNPEALLGIFADEYFLQPQTLAALKARFPSAAPAVPDGQQ